MRDIACLLIVLICMSCVAQENTHVPHSSWELRLDGIGDLRVGMTIRQVNAVLREQFSTPTGEDERNCFYIQPKGHSDTAIMMLNGRLARVDVLANGDSISSTATDSGVHVGDSEASVRAKYADKLRVSPHHYTDGHYLTIRSGKLGLRFETDEGKVTTFYSGTLRAIEFVEGCS